MLVGVVKRLYEVVCLQGHITNHSLHATAATWLFEAKLEAIMPA